MGLIRVGHKGADLIAPGNTIPSFEAAAQEGVDVIELDVIWLPDAHLPLEERAPLVVAHDWHDAERRTPMTVWACWALSRLVRNSGSGPLERLAQPLV